MSQNKICHMVIFCLQYKKGSSQAQQFLQEAKDILSKIPGVENFAVYEQISHKNDYDYVFSMEFADQDVYEAYNQHPDHVNFVNQRWKTEIERFLEIDFKK